VVSGNLASGVLLRLVLKPRRQNSVPPTSSSPLVRPAASLPVSLVALPSVSALLESLDGFLESAAGGATGLSTVEKGVMFSGKLYDASDPLLTFERRRCRHLLHLLNFSPPLSLPGTQTDSEIDPARLLRRRIYRELFSSTPEEAIKTLVVEPPFKCDYGCNIEVRSSLDLL